MKNHRFFNQDCLEVRPKLDNKNFQELDVLRIQSYIGPRSTIKSP